MAETKGMNQVLEIDEEKLTVTVQTGVTLWEFNDIRVIPGSNVNYRFCCKTPGLKIGKIRRKLCLER